MEASNIMFKLNIDNHTNKITKNITSLISLKGHKESFQNKLSNSLTQIKNKLEKLAE